ncbi:hypothetical protein N5D44_11115 [Acinetobacter junii]|uniref:phage tail tube protein n=1 Tax=Acinetobacter junii TaxID=40215 RepID=UPI00244693BF|nr:hypothetical protein [Acinetobacter junii]MDH1858840.1 hypothetical protein [Acinetobacter junii]
MSKPDLLSLQGELCLAKIVNGVAGALLPVGNMPTLKLKISSDKVDHYDSRYGQRAKDATLYKQTGVDIDGELDTVNKTSLALVMSGNSISIASEPITDRSLGTVTVGSIVDLGLRNLTDVTFKDGSDANIDSSKYILDAVFGTVEFIQPVTGAVKWSGTAAAKTRTTIANNTGSEYKILFKGIDTYTGDKVVVELHRLTLSPETEFDLINEDFNKFSITGSCMADNSKANDAELSVFGHIERFSVTA